MWIEWVIDGVRVCMNVLTNCEHCKEAQRTQAFLVRQIVFKRARDFYMFN